MSFKDGKMHLQKRRRVNDGCSLKMQGRKKNQTRFKNLHKDFVQIYNVPLLLTSSLSCLTFCHVILVFYHKICAISYIPWPYARLSLVSISIIKTF